MNNYYGFIEDIAFLNSIGSKQEDFKKLFIEGYFSDKRKWDEIKISSEINGLMDRINSRMKYSMSKMSLGVFNVLENGGGKNVTEQDELYLFSGFTEIETVGKIGKMIMIQNYSINPALFPNSVHHISTCYWEILRKISNYATTITDGPATNYSFICFIKNRIQIDGNFIVVTGEDSSDFFQYEEKNVLNIVPSFASYKVIPKKEKGFRFISQFDSVDEIFNSDFYKKSDYIFADKITFLELEAKGIKNIWTEYPIICDNPCGIIFRLAIPFYFDLKGNSIIIDKFKNKYFLFEVIL